MVIKCVSVVSNEPECGLLLLLPFFVSRFMPVFCFFLFFFEDCATKIFRINQTKSKHHSAVFYRSIWSDEYSFIRRRASLISSTLLCEIFLSAAQCVQQTPQKPRVRASLFHSFTVNYLSKHLTGPALQRSRGWSIRSHSLTSLWWFVFRVSDPTAEEEEEGPSQAGSSLPAVELPRKRKGDVEERSDTHVQ